LDFSRLNLLSNNSNNTRTNQNNVTKLEYIKELLTDFNNEDNIQIGIFKLRKLTQDFPESSTAASDINIVYSLGIFAHLGGILEHYQKDLKIVVI